MYIPPAFRVDSLDFQHGLIREHPLGLLITAGTGGLMANPLPFLIEADGSAFGKLRAHLARANTQLAELAEARECLVVFQGPQSYVTPSWYATKQDTGKVVPTWNYATVHAWGKPQIFDDASWLRQQIGELTDKQESRRHARWAVEDAPPDFITSQVKGIVGLEIPISRIEGKWKVSQNRPEQDRHGVITGLRSENDANDAMASLVENPPPKR